MAIPDKIRKPIIALVISAAGLGGIAVHEGYRDKAYIPVPGDVPTIGFGNTTYVDGSKVQLGDKITRKEAKEVAQKEEKAKMLSKMLTGEADIEDIISKTKVGFAQSLVGLSLGIK